MKRLPSREQVLALLDRLDQEPADALESDVLDFKRWQDARASMSEAIETAACFANADGGVIVFGVRDRVVGRRQAITGCTGYDVDTWQRAIYDATRLNLTVEIEELLVPEGNLLLVRVPRGPAPPYGTTAGLYQIRVGKNCMPYSPEAFQRRQVALGAIDWSAQPAEDLGLDALDGVEIARLRNTIESLRPQSPLLLLSDQELLEAIGAVRDGELTRAGLLLLGKRTVLARVLSQHEVIYLYEPTPVDIGFREDLKAPLLYIVQRTQELIQHPERNPVHTLRLGLFHVQIPAYPEESFREAILNALIHRDYLEPGSIYIHHRQREMVVSSPGGFIGGITPQNILHHEPKARNRLLAEVFQKIGLVERAGIGRRRIFIPPLAYGKRPPVYEADEHTVTLTLYDDSYDEALATFVVKGQQAGRQFDLDELLLLSYLREHSEIGLGQAAALLQRPEAATQDVLERLVLQPGAWLERRGKKKGVTYHLARGAAVELLGKAVYTRARGIDAVRWPELIRAYVEQHGSINNTECRELLGLGNSPSAQVRVSRLLRKLCVPDGFLHPQGAGAKRRYYLT
ncbi:MAG: putative DNA binding domain-containing protein [Anaerolineae bacterium]|nr:putative DNA binding domain-containing protein [Anaerolineae bacterium]